MITSFFTKCTSSIQNNCKHLMQQVVAEVQMIMCVSGPLFLHFLRLTDELFTFEGLNALSWGLDVKLM
jgi:hypothetical protein